MRAGRGPRANGVRTCWGEPELGSLLQKRLHFAGNETSDSGLFLLALSYNEKFSRVNPSVCLWIFLKLLMYPKITLIYEAGPTEHVPQARIINILPLPLTKPLLVLAVVRAGSRLDGVLQKGVSTS